MPLLWIQGASLWAPPIGSGHGIDLFRYQQRRDHGFHRPLAERVVLYRLRIPDRLRIHAVFLAKTVRKIWWIFSNPRPINPKKRGGERFHSALRLVLF